MPHSSESGRFPEDFAIGKLGRGDASREAYEAARRLLKSLAEGKEIEKLVLSRDRGRIQDFKAQGATLTGLPLRIGGGLLEQDGKTSFLFRAIGKRSSISGELHLQKQEGSWYLLDIILNEEATDMGEDGNYRFDPLSYRRFL
ncbi:hypothetical protein MASR2M78_04620 [Treponema sp.]